jgi:hypothetical protein
MKTDVSTKNTKNEILDAYNDLLKSIQEKKTEEPKKVQEREKQETAVKNAGELTNENIVKNISTLKVNLAASLDKLSENFIGEYRRFEELQQAIQVEKKNLQDLYQISAGADSLAAMLLAQKEKKEQFEVEMAQRKAELEDKIRVEKEKFETEMTEKRALWKREQEIWQAKLKEELEDNKKAKLREEEEFQYNLKLTRKKEADLYEDKKAKLEKELAEKKVAFEREFSLRETAVKMAETELNDLRQKTSAFPKELEKAVETAVKATTDRLEMEYRFNKELTAKQNEGEIKLRDQIIETLRSKIKDIETSLKELSQKTATAESTVKDIAMKAIESSTKLQIIDKNRESQNKE